MLNVWSDTGALTQYALHLTHLRFSKEDREFHKRRVMVASSLISSLSVHGNELHSTCQRMPPMVNMIKTKSFIK